METSASPFPSDILDVANEVLSLARARDKLIGTSESCTGGLVSAVLTEIPGSSDVFLGGIVSYSNELKQNLLGVANETLKLHGAVSAQTAEEMAVGAIVNLKVDLSVSVTGVAGPGGGSAEKPVGFVCFGLGRRLDEGSVSCLTTSQRFNNHSRSEVRIASTRYALLFLKRELLRVQ